MTGLNDGTVAWTLAILFSSGLALLTLAGVAGLWWGTRAAEARDGRPDDLGRRGDGADAVSGSVRSFERR